MNETHHNFPDLRTTQSEREVLMKSFDDQPRFLQWMVAILLAGVATGLVGMAAFSSAGLVGLRVDSPLQLGAALGVALVLFLPLWLLVFAFLFAPVLRLVGVLRYYSPILIVSRADPGCLCLHGAMPFDYVLLFRWCDRGRPAVRRILLWYVDGLISLARDIEQGRIPSDIEISATSYIFSEHSLRRFGFRVETASRLALGGVLTYPTQFLTYSFAQGRWCLPPVLRACKATIDSAKLCSQISELQRLQKRLAITDARSK